jgi:hypothetical protein
MATSYEAAVATLYQAPLADFVGERKRLAQELKGHGDAAAAARLGKLSRPPVSTWAVNQLWWRQRDAFEALLATAGRLRQGDLSAGSEHQSALATLRREAAELLREAGHGSADATLRRVTANLSALAASGGFEPDLPGALAADREAPGFDAALGMLLGASSSSALPSLSRDEKRRRDDERERRLLERRRLEGEIKSAREVADRLGAETERLQRALRAAEAEAESARTTLAELCARLADLEGES